MYTLVVLGGGRSKNTNWLFIERTKTRFLKEVGLGIFTNSTCHFKGDAML